MKIKVEEAIIVEGKYDKIKLSSIFDALIIDIGGFHIFKDKEKAQLIEILANTRGVIIMTDSDDAGNLIRNKLNSIIKSGSVFNAYIPQILGKEKRKLEPSKQGFLGVEGIDKEIIIKSLLKCGIKASNSDNLLQITNLDLYNFGFTGTDNSKQKRTILLSKLGLPNNITKNNLLKIINYHITRLELEKISNEIEEELQNGRQS